MLLRHPERILAEHQVPAHRGMTRGVGATIPHFQRSQRLAPSNLRHLYISHGLAGVAHEDMIVMEFAGSREALAQAKLSPQHV